MALKVLKKKKRLEKRLDTAFGALANLEAQRDDIESATMNAEIMNSTGFLGPPRGHQGSRRRRQDS